MRAVHKQQLWETGTNLLGWLFAIMYNEDVNNFRRAARENGSIAVEDVASTVIATTDPTASRQLLQTAIAQLPVEQRETILLIGLEGMRYDEAAAVMGVPIGTVRSRLSRDRDLLSQLFEGEVGTMKRPAA